MVDREKIIKALTECIFLHEHPDDDAGCFGCPYRPDEKGTCPTMIPFLKDVLELLKEQEPVNPRFIDGKRNHFVKCGNCNFNLMHGMKFCPHCGRAVKWNA